MNKKSFIVNVREVYIQPYKVEAETNEEAIRIVADGGGDLMEDCLEYSHTLDPDTWAVEECC